MVFALSVTPPVRSHEFPLISRDSAWGILSAIIRAFSQSRSATTPALIQSIACTRETLLTADVPRKAQEQKLVAGVPLRFASLRVKF